ncbi:HAD-IIA family hydrolase [Nocardioides caldifontis]|uniref:HAD-IIA family hydrolase n=1 Tax=Nocardioides caldifontis TaxID=2588938 RepID=UPI001EF09C38|nr:HAD-IIA family hydrolase [Nocardioides caldifontis]
MATGPEQLEESTEPLCDAYDLAMLDLDGVVYVGRHAVPDAPGDLAAASARGMHLAYVTNNASRPPAAVAAHLQELGIGAAPEDVVTSAQAAARLVAERVPAGAAVFVIGGAGLVEALEELGLRPTQAIDDGAVAVVSGYGPDLRWRTIMDGAMLVREGLPWVVSNTDMTVPTPRGPGPGNGVLVKAVADYAQVEPVVAGKPRPPLFHETRRRVGGERPLVVGDRLDTDIEGARLAGYDSLLVMTGVTDLAQLVTAEPGRRPSYVAGTLAALLEPQPRPIRTAAGWSCRRWRATVTDGVLELRADQGDRLPAEPRGQDADDWWRVAAAAGWEHLDTNGTPVDVAGVELPGRSPTVPAAGRQ